MSPSLPAGVDQLAKLVDGLNLDEASQKYPNCFPSRNPFDLYRAHLAGLVAGLANVDAKIVYPSLQWTSGLDKGDIVMATPALRMKGKKPDELAKEIAEQVRDVVSPKRGAAELRRQLTPGLFAFDGYSFRRIPCSRSRPSPATSCRSISRRPL